LARRCVDLATLSAAAGSQSQPARAFADPLLSGRRGARGEIAELAATAPNAARAVLALYRAWRVAREDAGGIALPSGRRVLLPNEEARDFFDDRANHFASLETAAETIAGELRAAPAEMNHAIAERLRRVHGLTVTVQTLEGALRRYDPATHRLALSEVLPRESRGFHMAFQLALLEARDVYLDPVARADAAPSWRRKRYADPVGLLNYVAGARRCPMPRSPMRRVRCATTWRRWQRASACRSSRPAIGCPRYNGRRRGGAVLLPARRSGGQCRSASRRRGFRSRAMGRARAGWCTPPARPGRQVQVAELPDGAAYLFRTHGDAAGARLGDPRPVRRGDGLQPGERRGRRLRGRNRCRAREGGIGLSCRLCRPDCRSRRFLAEQPAGAGSEPSG
jgi:predicted transcriptional regulator